MPFVPVLKCVPLPSNLHLAANIFSISISIFCSAPLFITYEAIAATDDGRSQPNKKVGSTDASSSRRDSDLYFHGRLCRGR
jgi:hypothetical protein